MEEPRQQRQAAGHPSHIEHSAGRFGSPSLSWDCYGLRPTLSLSFHLIFSASYYKRPPSWYRRHSRHFQPQPLLLRVLGSDLPLVRYRLGYASHPLVRNGHQLPGTGATNIPVPEVRCAMAGTSLILLVWRSEEDKESFPVFGYHGLAVVIAAFSRALSL